MCNFPCMRDCKCRGAVGKGGGGGGRKGSRVWNEKGRKTRTDVGKKGKSYSVRGSGVFE